MFLQNFLRFFFFKFNLTKKKMAAMKRFLDSLQVHVNEAKDDLTNVRSRYLEVSNQYKTISKTAHSRLLDTTRQYRPRARSVVNRKPYISRSYEPRKPQKPKYIPASQYPVPMQPRLFKPTVNSFNAERVAKLSEMRPNKVIIEDLPDLPDDSSKVPPLDIEQLN